jgi:hypothetical protein
LLAGINTSVVIPILASGLPFALLAPNGTVDFTGASQIINMSPGEFNISSTTTVDLVADAVFTTSTMTSGGSIECVRQR